jgi:hypothetical protein
MNGRKGSAVHWSAGSGKALREASPWTLMISTTFHEWRFSKPSKARKSLFVLTLDCVETSMSKPKEYAKGVKSYIIFSSIFETILCESTIPLSLKQRRAFQGFPWKALFG